MRKKFLILMSLFLIISASFSLPINAEKEAKVSIPVEINGNSAVEITTTNNAPLPSNTIINIAEKGNIDLSFSELGTYYYDIKQVLGSDPDLNYDTTLYHLVVSYYYNDANKLTLDSYVYKDGSDTKEDKISFNNTPIEKYGTVIVEYRDINTGKIIKTTEFVIKDGKVGTKYSTTPPTIEGYKYVKLDDKSAKESGLVTEGEQRVIYLYEKAKGSSVIIEYRDIDTGELISDSTYVLEDGVEGTPYNTKPIDIPGYELIKISDDSAPENGTSILGELRVIYLYRKIKKEPAIIDPPVEKVVIGSPSKKAVFTFVLEALEANNPMPEGSEGNRKETSVEGSASFEFGEMAFDTVGTYKYHIYEKNTGENGYTYDMTIYTMTVEVTENNNKLSAKKTIKANDKVVDIARFINTYNEERRVDPPKPQPSVPSTSAK